MASNASRRENTARRSVGRGRGPLNASVRFNETVDRAKSPMQHYINEVAGGGESPALPAVNQRLGYLRPSRELLEYYRKKIAEYDTEHEEMTQKLDQYKATYEEQHKIQWELRQREEEITELQKALSDMQVYLFQEREHVLRLYAENDRLKIRELDDRKRIQQLLTLSGGAENEVSYFFKEPPSKVVIPQKLPKKTNAETAAKATKLRGKQPVVVNEKHKQAPEEREKEKRDAQTLALQVEALQAQLEEQSKLAREQSEAMMEDRRVKMEEYDAGRLRDDEKIAVLTEKLHKTQDLLYMSTQDYLKMKYDWRTDERVWMVEKDKMLRELDLCKQQLNISAEDKIFNVSDGAMENTAKIKEECECLRNELEQAQKLSDMYREQVIELEGDLSRVREEEDVSRVVFQDRTTKMTKRLELMNQRYQDLEKRRNLEVEGFKNDIKNLRKRLKDMERQLYRVTIGFAEKDENITVAPDDIDLAILKNVNRTSRKARGMQGDLKHLKSKIYGLENELKHL